MAKRKLAEALQAIDILEAAGFEARMAGGCVRDRLIGIEPRDYDVATNAAPDRVCKIFEQAKIKVVPTGFNHGTVTLVMPAGPVEVTTLRIDLETYGRHATVALGTSFQEDAARRDFTVNSMFEDKRGQIHDYFNGQEDLRKRILRFVGDPETRIKEDYLRIMRLFRFWSRFEFHPAEGTMKAIIAHRDGLQQISQERITYELHRIFDGRAVIPVLDAMLASGVLQIILPELATESGLQLPAPGAVSALQAIKSPSEKSVALFALLMIANNMNSTERIKSTATRLRLAKTDIKKLCFLSTFFRILPDLNARQSDFMELLDQADDVFGSQDAWSLILKTFFDALVAQTGLPALQQVSQKLQKIEREKSHIRKAELPLSALEVISILKLKPGPEVGTILENLRAAFRNEEWFSKAEGEEWLRRTEQTTI